MVSIAAYSHFWTEERIRQFRGLLPNIATELKITEKDFETGGTCRSYAAAILGKQNAVGSKSSYWRFRNGSDVSSKILCSMIIGMGELLEHKSNQPGFSKNEYLTEFKDFYQIFLEEGRSLTDPKKLDSQYRTMRHTSRIQEIHSALDIMTMSLGIGVRVGERAENRLFYNNYPRININDAHKIYFDTYRFSSNPGYIQKSFTIIERTTRFLPFVSFRNFLDHDGGQRVSRGIILPFKKYTVFLGQSDGGAAAKFMTIPYTNTPQRFYNGLLISDEPGQGIVSAKFLMKRSKFIHSNDAETGLYAIDDIIDEDQMNEKEINSIRNEVKFVMEEPIFDSDGYEISQREMVELVGTLLRNADGDSKFKRWDGSSFNPASDDFYTFNSTIKIK